MKWHDYHPEISSYASALGIPKRLTLDEARKEIWAAFREGNDEIVSNMMAAQLGGEVMWCDAGRPYYNVYPSVIDAFTKLNLEGVDCESVRLPLPALLIRFPVGSELCGSVRCFLVSNALTTRAKSRSLRLAIDFGYSVRANDRMVTSHTAATMPMHFGSVSSQLKGLRKCAKEDDTRDWSAVESVMQLLCALCLLKGNADLIEPEPLEADRAKWEKTHDPALIAKAAKRGKVAWSVGKHIEVAPGFRRPHFAIRWMGKGGTDPRLRPIKGCLVRKREITEVPTGYLDDEEIITAVATSDSGSS